MNEPYTPTTEQVRESYSYDAEHEYRNPTDTGYVHRNRREFDRWLKRVRAETLREAAEGFQEELGANAANPGPKYIVGWLNNRAAQEEATGDA